AITNPDNTVRTFAYDNSHRLLNEQWGPTNITYTYDTATTGVLTQVNRGLGTTLGVRSSNVPALLTMTALNADAAVATATDGLMHTTTHTLDMLGRRTKLQRPGIPAETWQRDDAGQVTAYTDGRGDLTTYTYQYGNSKGDLLRIDYADLS